jgi:hypothetical protein
VVVGGEGGYGIQNVIRSVFGVMEIFYILVS